jgi:3-deoxy-D-manno-octulosonic-acid transferase
MIFTYKILAFILYPFLYLFIFVRKIIKKEDSERYKEKLLVSHFNINKKNDKKLILFHAASIGEFKSIIPIIEKLNTYEEKFEFLITTTTLSSGNLAEKELKKFSNIQHRYLPLDVPFLVNKFLSLWAPSRIFLVDSEIWPNLILKTKELKIPIALINARLTSRSFKRWLIFFSTAKKIFQIFELCLCSNSETKKFLERLNAKSVFFKGNIKLISQSHEKKITNINENFLKTKRFWLAASIHKEEDVFCLKTHLELKKKFKQIATILAPRHIERISKLKSLAEKLNIKVQVLNTNEIILNDSEVIIINYFGALQNYFKYAKSVFIGKSITKKFQSDGGQNPIDAAKLGCKIYHGPYVYNFKEIYEILEKNNISKKVISFEELTKNLTNDFSEPYKIENKTFDPMKNLEQKTLNDTMPIINKFILNENK